MSDSHNKPIKLIACPNELKGLIDIVLHVRHGLAVGRNRLSVRHEERIRFLDLNSGYRWNCTAFPCPSRIGAYTPNMPKSSVTLASSMELKSEIPVYLSALQSQGRMDFPDGGRDRFGMMH